MLREQNPSCVSALILDSQQLLLTPRIQWNLTITRFREIEVFFHIYYFYQGKENRWGDGESQEKLKNFAFSFLKKVYYHKMSVRQTKKTV